MDSPSVSVIVTNWNGKHLLPLCLESLRGQRFRSFRTLLVDNGSTDGSVDFVRRRYPEVTVIPLHRNTGFAVANNRALETVSTPYAALLNNDAEADPRWLLSLVDALERHPPAGFAASKMVFLDQPATVDRAGDGYTVAGAAFLRGRGAPSDAYSREEWVFGACAGAALYRMSMLREIGFFDEDFFILCEDVDLSFRAQLRGYRCIFVPGAVVRHGWASTIGRDSPPSVFYGHRNVEWVYVKNMPSRLIFRTILPHVIYDIVAFLYFLIRGRGGVFAKAKMEALGGLGKMFAKRRKIQRLRSVPEGDLWKSMDREMFWKRRIAAERPGERGTGAEGEA